MAVSGPISHRRLSEDAIAALEAGDIDALMHAERAEFGGFAVMMADDDDDADDDEQDNDDNDDGDAGDSGSGKKSGDDDDDDDAESELDKARKRMKAADKRAAEAERKLRDRENADKSDLEKATLRVEELEKSVTELQARNRDLTLQNAFLTSNTQTWHDPDAALALAGSKGYLKEVMDEDGEVDRKALKKALERLGTEHKYLVKSDKDDRDDHPGGPSGEPAGGRSDNRDDDKAKKARMQKRFPILNR